MATIGYMVVWALVQLRVVYMVVWALVQLRVVYMVVWALVQLWVVYMVVWALVQLRVVYMVVWALVQLWVVYMVVWVLVQLPIVYHLSHLGGPYSNPLLLHRHLAMINVLCSCPNLHDVRKGSFPLHNYTRYPLVSIQEVLC